MWLSVQITYKHCFLEIPINCLLPLQLSSKTASTVRSVLEPATTDSGGVTDDYLTPVIDSTLEKLTASNPGVSSVDGEGVETVVEESGPVQYDDGEEGLDDDELEELAYEDDPLLQSDYEDEGGWGQSSGGV